MRNKNHAPLYLTFAIVKLGFECILVTNAQIGLTHAPEILERLVNQRDRLKVRSLQH